MATKDEKDMATDVTTQTELVSSPILWQCLYVIRTVAGFESLSFRVTKTLHDVENVVVYREKLSGVFGPPVDPITLTFDPKGKCLVHVLFKPVQRVSIVSAMTGQIEIASLLAVLRMLAGKGFKFCPGLPEKFLAGKACGRFVVMHRVPFKRYQSSQCPVYYQVPPQQNNGKSSLCAICPRCMQAAKWIKTLPVLAPNATATVAVRPPQQTAVGQARADQRVVRPNVANIGHYFISGENGAKISSLPPPTSINELLSGAKWHTRTAAAVPGGQEITISNIVGNAVASADLNGKFHKAVMTKTAVSSGAQGALESNALLIEKLQSLKNKLQEGQGQRPEIKEEMGDNKDSEKAANPKMKQGKKEKVKNNRCRQCKKHFSTPASLLNHLQRHEGVSAAWKKQFQEKRGKHQATSALFKILSRGSNIRSGQSQKKFAGWSGTSSRLLVKYLDNCLDAVSPSQHGAKTIRQQDPPTPAENRKTPSVSSNPELQSVPSTQTECDSGSRASLKRSSSGLSPMQTLLEAAAYAGEEAEDLSSPTASSDSAFSTVPSQPEAAINLSNLPQSFSSNQTAEESDEIPNKKVRKSSRLASRKAKKKRKGDDDSSETVEIHSVPASNDSSMLTNLNLLSTVSLETAMRDKPGKSLTHTSVSRSVPVTVLSPQHKTSTAAFPTVLSTSLPTSALPTSNSVSIPYPLLNNTSGGNVMVKSTQNKPFSSLQNQADLPPVPPLLFAGQMLRTNEAFSFASNSSPQQQCQPDHNQPVIPSVVPVAQKDLVKNPTSTDECGAIDLSKPKPAQALPNIPLSLVKDVDLIALTGLPHNFAQLIGNDNPADLPQYLKMVSKATGSKAPAIKEIPQPPPPPPPAAFLTNKQADSDLQARLFASARNYRIDKTPKAQVQASIASTNRLAQQKRPGALASNQGDEIQCGYKWSGSGGLVKERTQMVREVVSSDIMANYLSKAQQANSVAHQALPVSSHPSSSLSQQLLVQSPAPTKPQDLSTPQLALNLTTNKPPDGPVHRKGGPGRPRKTSSALAVPPSPPMQAWSPTSPIATPRSILRSSLLNPNSTNLVSHLIGNRLPAPVDSADAIRSSPQNTQQKAINLSQTSSPSPQPATHASCTISSPSLAAMLRQPATNVPEVNHSDSKGVTARSTNSPVTSPRQNSVTPTASVLSLPGGVQIKTEPMDTFIPGDAMVIMSLPVKAERRDSDADKNFKETSRDDDGSPRLVMDIRPTRTPAVSRAAELNSTLKCEH